MTPSSSSCRPPIELVQRPPLALLPAAQSEAAATEPGRTPGHHHDDHHGLDGLDYDGDDDGLDGFDDDGGDDDTALSQGVNQIEDISFAEDDITS